MKYRVEKEDQLLSFLFSVITNKSKNTVKNILKKGSVYVNNKSVTKFDYPLHRDDIVEIKKIVDDLEIIYEDKNIIVINKKAGLPTIADSKNKENNLYHLVSNYLKKQNKNNKVFIIHRLDRDTSGILVFAKSEFVQKKYQKNWNDLVILREYTAIVEGKLDKKQATLKNKLNESKEGYVYVSKIGKLAITSYQVIQENKDYSLLKVHLETGRKNQIRVQLSNIEHPIVGDKKYKAKTNPIKKLGLHANKLELIDPINKQKMTFEVTLPKEFKKLFKNN